MNFLGFVDAEANFALDDKAAFRAALQKFKGQEVVLSLKRRPTNTSTQQYRYLRGVIIPDIAVASGYSDPSDYEDVWEGIAWRFLRLPDGPFGQPRRRSTSRDQMTREELTKLIDDIIIYAESSIPGCTIRRPEDVDMDTVVDPEWTA